MKTSLGCRGERNRLKVHGEEERDREVARCDKKITKADEDRYTLLEQSRGEDWLTGPEDFGYKE